MQIDEQIKTRTKTICVLRKNVLVRKTLRTLRKTIQAHTKVVSFAYVHFENFIFAATANPCSIRAPINAINLNDL
jgi:hypothetical protein